MDDIPLIELGVTCFREPTALAAGRYPYSVQFARIAPGDEIATRSRESDAPAEPLAGRHLPFTSNLPYSFFLWTLERCPRKLGRSLSLPTAYFYWSNYDRKYLERWPRTVE